MRKISIRFVHKNYFAITEIVFSDKFVNLFYIFDFCSYVLLFLCSLFLYWHVLLHFHLQSNNMKAAACFNVIIL